MALSVESYEDVHVIKGYATPEKCSELVTMIDKAKSAGKMSAWAEQAIPNYVIDTPNPKGQKFIDKYVRDLSHIAGQLYGSTVELVREQTNFTLWPVGCGRIPHYDNEHQTLWYTTVLYLNDDYESGEIRFTQKGITLKPQAGDVVIFRPLAPNMEHEVLPVQRKPRYTLAVWLQSETPFSTTN